MNSLTIIENKAITSLPVLLREIVKAKYDLAIKTISDPSLEVQIKNMIVVAYAEMGLTLDKKNERVVTFLRETLMVDFRKPKYETVSFELIKMFVCAGVRGEYPLFNGQLNTINIRNIHHWINEGLKSEKYKYALKEHQAMIEKEIKREPSIIEKEFLSKKGCLDAFERYKKNKEIPFGAFAYYDVLNDFIGVEYKNTGKKTLVSDPAVRKEITTRLTEKHTKELLREKTKHEKRGNLGVAEGLMSAITADFKNTKSLENLIKAEFLMHFFDQLIKENKTLEFPENT